MGFRNILSWFEKQWKEWFPVSGVDVTCRAVMGAKVPTIRRVVMGPCNQNHDIFHDTCRAVAAEAGAVTMPERKTPALISIQRIENRDAKLFRIACGMKEVLDVNGQL